MKRISKRQARELFATNQPFYICPVKLHPYPPFSSASLIFRNEYSASGENPSTGNIFEDFYNSTYIPAWDVMYNNWAYYNTSWETGYYASYWVES